MAINIEMPKLSETMTEGILLRWNKRVGDFVDVGELIAEVETDKATISIECFDDGFLIEQKAAEGAVVPVGAVLAVLDSRMPTDCGADTTPVSRPSVEMPRRLSSPLARKLALSLGVDMVPLSGKGSGPKGRIMAGDVKKAAEEASRSQAPAAAPVTAAPSPASREEQEKTPSAPSAPPAGSILTPLSPRQKFVAQKTVSAKSNIPHSYLTVEVDVTQLAHLRSQVNIQAEKSHGHHFTVNDFIIKAMVNACVAVPSVNASFDEARQGIVFHKNIGVNIAVNAGGSVLFPVIPDAEGKNMLALSQDVVDLAQRGKENKLRPSDFEGGTITLSNLGAYGVDNFYGIINAPQAAIVTVGAMTEKPVVRKGRMGAGLRMSLSMSCDYRVVSGPDAARFLHEMKTLLETPTLILV